MISAKSPREIATMKQAGKIVALARAAVAAAIAPGVTTKQLDRIAERVIRQQGASPSFKGVRGLSCVYLYFDQFSAGSWNSGSDCVERRRSHFH